VAGTDVNVVVAFAGGLASFASPCVLPLVPAYLAVVGGLDLTRRGAVPSPSGSPTGLDGAAATAVARGPGGYAVDQDTFVGRRGAAAVVGRGGAAPVVGRRSAAVTVDTALFVAGFGVVFVLLGLSASELGRLVIHQQGLLTRVSGVVVVAMALFLGASLILRSPTLYGEWRLHPKVGRFGRLAAPIAGAAFAFGWTPCVGPVLASVLALSSTQDRVATAAVLLAAYTLGLGLPFLLVAVFFDHLGSPLRWLRAHGNAVTGLSAAGLGGLGLLLVLDRLAWVTTQVQQLT
jgi:cytochrome c-type biogenesis protein